MAVNMNGLTWKSHLYASVILDTSNDMMAVRAEMSVSHELQ